MESAATKGGIEPPQEPLQPGPAPAEPPADGPNADEKPAGSAAWLSLGQYAARKSCNESTVRKAIRSGRLAGAVARRGGREWIKDAELADRLWALGKRQRKPDSRDARPDMTGGNPDQPSEFLIARTARETAAAQREQTNAEIAKLDLAKRRGELIEVARARAVMARDYSAVRTQLLALSIRIGQRLPHLPIADVREIDKLVRAALTELAENPTP
jgi:phage terminase Nu1 subunit (DNA packaging protein)